MPGTTVVMEAAIDERDGDGPVRLGALYREHGRAVLRAAYRVTGNLAEAEDVLQTVFLRLATRGTDGVGRAYLLRAAVNGGLDCLRTRRWGDADPAESVARAPGPDRLAESGALREALRDALARLAPRTAEMFLLRHVEGLPNREIAALLGTTPGTVAVTVNRARAQLRELLGDWRGER